MSRRNLENVAEAYRVAKRRLPPSVYYSLLAGVERGTTRESNADAFDQIGIIPRLGDLGADHDQSTTVMGQQVAMPVVISPTGTQAIEPAGEVAVARAAKKAGILQGLSTFASRSIEDVVHANDKTFFQLYWFGRHEDIEARVERARAAGAVALAVTLDWALTHRADWGRPPIPSNMGLRTILSNAPEGLRRPGWVWRFLKSGGLPRLEAPNARSAGDAASPPLSSVFTLLASTPPPTWEEIRWLRQIWGNDRPFMVKGVMHPDDARHAVDIGATAISVSNHGGNNLDTTPASIRALPAVVDAVGSQVEVVMDGGIRRGTDVVKALALGAKAVMIGRPYLMALAAGGERGVTQILAALHDGIHETLLGLGKPSVHDLIPSDVLLPDGFAIRDFPK
ncbi:pre-mycofactocin synthase MftD [Pseudonocardia oroxyli]|uniref:L-lactate dehydrogenase (Cytochrome)/glycolate oxidase n=1 Tax=Pseudonocardia oroxyli TaxID=366584 RepID=A0A1G8EID6_PSEOR|nr:pre-mycofactocin synthase MftD [Pseudonocardia oroxyli]SDH69602.1 L-lactate dehydrogenase (cytochrome)/glycolate oxidase [Pseudonocardia oroxyli]